MSGAVASAAMAAQISTMPPRVMHAKTVQRAGSAGKAQPLARPIVVVVMGVSGSGKTTVAAMFAGRLHWRFEEGDSLHSPTNVAKMISGIPLTDADRLPWLRAIAAVIAGWITQGQCGIVTCSALKRSYRRILTGGNQAVRLVYLKGSKELIRLRLAARHGHFMAPSLLDSQFETLEEPEADEHPIVISIERRLEDIVTEIAAAVGVR